MILYRFDPHMQKTARQLCRAMFLFLACVCLAGCAEIRSFYSDTSSGMRDVSVFCDNIRYVSQVPLTATVSDALTAVGIRLESSDIVTPGLSQAVPADGVIRVTRISSSDVVTEQVIPFPSRTVRNESLPDGEMRIVQQGQNGLRQITTRYTYENGVQSSKAVVSAITVREPIPEILMRGAKAEYAPIKITGRLIYISDGNAWMMEGSTENRTPLVSTGDLDGRVLDLSSDGKWLLFSRAGETTARLWGVSPSCFMSSSIL